MTPGEFFGYLFYVRDTAHLTHLSQPDRTLATHLALNDLYDGILGLVDGLVEDYQGVHGIVPITIPQSKSVSSPLKAVEDCYSYINTNRGIFKESWIQNIIDEIQELLAKTLYKLKFVQ